MIAPSLLILERRATEALAALPGANPLTISEGIAYSSDDGPARHALEKVCAGAHPDDSNRLMNEYFGAGPLENLLRDPSITEIIVNGTQSIWFEKYGQLHRMEDHFFSALTYRNFISRMSREAGIQASLDCPFADGRWRSCRVHLIIPPASGDEAVITLRRHPQNSWTFERLRETNWASPTAFERLEKLVEEKANFLVVGCTGSGKTSVLDACLAKIGSSERTVIIEDTSELKPPNAASVKLLTRKDPHGHLRDIDQSDLLRQALRMRPDRLVMGEIRSGEAKDLLMAFATGHTGCMGTLHADSARQALLRLEMLVQLGAPQWNVQAVRTLIWLSLQAVVVVKREGSERKLEGIYRIASLEDVGFLIEKEI
jgi:pilus assembly protein CpaF